MAEASPTRQRASGTKRFVLLYLLFIGIPAALELSSTVNVQTARPQQTWGWFDFSRVVGVASLVPTDSRQSFTIVAGNGAVAPLTLVPWTASQNAFVMPPMPKATFDLTFELHQVGDGGAVTNKWVARDQLDSGSLTLSELWISLRVSLSRIAGTELPPGNYRLFVDFLETAGPKAGSKALALSSITVLPPPEIPFPDPPNYMPDVLAFEFDHFAQDAAGWVGVFNVRNVSPVTLTFSGRAPGLPPAGARVIAAEGDRFSTVVSSASLWRRGPVGGPGWVQMGANNTGGGIVELPPGVGIELHAPWVEHGFGVRAAQVFMSGAGRQAWIASDPFEVGLDDSPTSGSVVVWISGVSGSLPKLKGRSLKNWRGVQEEAPGKAE